MWLMMSFLIKKKEEKYLEMWNYFINFIIGKFFFYCDLNRIFVNINFRRVFRK